MDLRKGIIVSRTNLVDSKKEATISLKGIGLVVFIVLAFWAGAFYHNGTVKKKIVNLQQELNSVKSGRDYKKIALVADSESRLKSVDEILKNRIDWEILFKKIEENTLPEVTFTSMEIKTIEKAGTADSLALSGENNVRNQVALKGTTIGLNNLSKQILAFEGTTNSTVAPLFKDVKVEKIEIKKTDSGVVDTGRSIDFTIRSDINPAIFEFEKEDNKPNN